MSLKLFNDTQAKAFNSGWRVGYTAAYYEILHLRNRCNWPEDVEIEIDEWLEKNKNGGRFRQ